MRYFICLFLSITFNSDLFSQNIPVWHTNLRAQFPQSSYMATVSIGSKTEALARQSAYAELAKSIKSSVQVSTRAEERYQRSDLYATKDSKLIETVVNNSSVDLVYASIEGVYYDADIKNYYAIAVIEKEKALKRLNSLINEYKNITDEYLKNANTKKDPFAKFSLLEMAAISGAKCWQFYEQLLWIGGSHAKLPWTAQQLRLMADKAAEVVTFTLNFEKLPAKNRLSIEKSFTDRKIKLSKNGVYQLRENLEFDFKNTGFNFFIAEGVLRIDFIDQNGETKKSFLFEANGGGADKKSAEAQMYQAFESLLSKEFPSQFNAFLNEKLK